MTYSIFSSHAPTGESSKVVVSPNEYSTEGRNVGYPNNFSCYVRKISSADGSQAVVESRTASDLVGSRLYLYHRPLLNSDGTVSTITVSDGVLNTTLTNARQGYVVFSSLPSSSFTVTYTAAPDCDSMWHINTLQDDVMELQQVLGVNNDTGYPGLRNLAFGVFDSPLDANLSGIALRSVYLSHLDDNIVIGSTNESSLTGARGVEHTIQIGRGGDYFIADVQEFTIKQSDATRDLLISLGTKTGDFIQYSGQMSGEGPLTVGGPAWPGYSGLITGAMTTGFYTGAMMRVNGDLAVLGDVQAVGSITITNLTGEVSTVIGDFTVTDDLEVRDQSTLIGVTTTNRIVCQENIRLHGDLTALNINGNGGNGQTLIDGLDASEVAHSYKTVTRKVIPNTVLRGIPSFSHTEPTSGYYTFAGFIGYPNLAGDIWQYTGFATATAGPSGAHPNIIQMNFADDPLPVVSGNGYSLGRLDGIWSAGLMDPGSLHLLDLVNGFQTPIYGYTIESGDGSYIYKLNVFSPVLDTTKRVTVNDSLLIYNPYSRPYAFLTAAGGASPTFAISASATYPFEVAFEDEVRKMTSSSTNISLTNALTYSITGLAGTSLTGTAYVFAKNNTDPESPPSFSARNIPYRMPGETVIGEITAHYSGSQWHILDTTSYRPGGVYDSSWIPMFAATGYSGRAIGGLTTAGKVVYFKHDLGCDIDLYRVNAEMYLGYVNSAMAESWDQAQPLSRALMSTDLRTQVGFSGGFTKVPLTNTHYSGSTTLDDERDASLCYLDGRFIGVHIDSKLLEGAPGSSEAFNYLRLIVRRDS